MVSWGVGSGIETHQKPCERAYLTKNTLAPRCEDQGPLREVHQLSIVDRSRLPCWICVVVESIGVVEQQSEFGDISCGEYFSLATNALVA